MKRIASTLIGLMGIVACGDEFSSGSISNSTGQSSAGGASSSQGGSSSSVGGSNGGASASGGAGGNTTGSAGGTSSSTGGSGGSVSSGGHGGTAGFGGSGGVGGTTTSSTGGGGNGTGGSNTGGGNTGGGDAGVPCQCDLPHATTSCLDNVCSLVKCDADYENCNKIVADGCEAFLLADPKTCGSCGKKCTQFETCKSGACEKNSCGQGTADCNNNPNDGCEVTLGTMSNCAYCGDACVLANVKTATCSQQSCQIDACQSGFGNCDKIEANGCEANLGSSVANCGACGTACTSGPKSSPTCSSGMCGMICDAGFTDCNDTIADGCEVNLKTDPLHCGTCQTACVVPNAVPGCTNGACAVASCLAGFADCDGDPKNGCETSIKIDADNCGACSKVCAAWPHSSPACTNGVCGIACSPNYANCNNAIGDGCEIDLKTDPVHCGSCQTVCSIANGVAGCTNGSCSVASCDQSRADCNGLVGDGCEVNLKTDPVHCGTCQNVCSIPNGTPGCTNGSCSVASCDQNRADCNGLVGDGCEVNLKTDPAHCGTCQNVCSIPNGVAGCTNGSCSVASCDATHLDCNGIVSDGCEVMKQTDANNCGACGNVCGANTVCLSGFCNPLGLCGPIPQSGVWLCYQFPNHQATLANSHVGFAGGVNVKYTDPFTGPLGNCVNPVNSEDAYMCFVGSLVKGDVVRLVPGLHPSVNLTTAGVGFACDTNGVCKGQAELYIDGQVLGKMSNSTPTGLLSLVLVPESAGRYGLRFVIP